MNKLALTKRLLLACSIALALAASPARAQVAPASTGTPAAAQAVINAIPGPNGLNKITAQNIHDGYQSLLNVINGMGLWDPVTGSYSVVLQAAPATTTQTLSSFAAERFSVRAFGAACDGVTDDSTALANAVNALNGAPYKPGSTLLVPGNCRLRLAGASQVWLRGVHIMGPGVKEIGANSNYAYGSQGGTIIIDTPTLAQGGVSPFVASSDWSLTGLNFYWAGQTEYTAGAQPGASASYGAAVPFAPLISSHGTDQAYFWSFSDNQVENAYDIADLSGSADPGHWHWERNTEFAAHYHIILKENGGETWVTNNQFSYVGAYYLTSGSNAAGPGGTQSPFYLRTFAMYNGEVLHIIGNGTTSAQSSYAVAGMRFNNNYVYSERYGVHIVGGKLDISTLTDNGFDEVSTPLQVDSGGAMTAGTITGGTWICQNFAAPNGVNAIPQQGGGAVTGAVAPCLSVSGGAPGSQITMANVLIGDAVGAGIVFNDTGVNSNLNIAGGSFQNVGNAAAGNPYTGVSFNAPQGNFTMSGTSLTSTSGLQTAAVAVAIGTAKSGVVSGVTFEGWAIPVTVTGTSGGYSVTGSASFNTTSAYGTLPVQGAGSYLVMRSGNNWDKSPEGSYFPVGSLSAASNSQATYEYSRDGSGNAYSTSAFTDTAGYHHVTAGPVGAGVDTEAGPAGFGSGAHLFCYGPAPTLSASAGTATLSAGANDCHGTITASAAATINLKFASATTNAPDCALSPHGGALPTYSTTGGAVGTAGISLTTAAAQVVTYSCLEK